MVNGVERYLPNVSHGDLLGEPGNLDTTLRQPDPASSAVHDLGSTIVPPTPPASARSTHTRSHQPRENHDEQLTTHQHNRRHLVAFVIAAAALPATLIGPPPPPPTSRARTRR